MGGVSALIGLMGWLLVVVSPATGAAFYRAIRLPQGVVQFWDLRLTLETVDCARWGFNVFETNNGCLADPSIYGPGITWWRFTFGLLTESNTTVGATGNRRRQYCPRLGRQAEFWSGRCRAARRGGRCPMATATRAGKCRRLGSDDRSFRVWLTRRWNSYWAWSIAAVGIWLAGTKYYPCSGDPSVAGGETATRVDCAGRIRCSRSRSCPHGDNVLLSLSASSGMAELGDFVVLGRIPAVARLPETWSTGDVLCGYLRGRDCLGLVSWSH